MPLSAGHQVTDRRIGLRSPSEKRRADHHEQPLMADFRPSAHAIETTGSLAQQLSNLQVPSECTTFPPSLRHVYASDASAQDGIHPVAIERAPKVVSRTVFIVDTNVVVAGLLTADDTSPVARVLDGMLGAAFPFVVSEALLAEYHAVFVRPGLRKLHGLAIADVDTLLIAISRHAIELAPVTAAAAAPDPGDQLLWDLLAARADLTLVTGDKLLLKDPPMRGRVISPREFVAGR